MSAGPVLGNWLGTFQNAALTQMVLALLAFTLLLRVPERFKPHPHRAKRTLAAALDHHAGHRRVGFVQRSLPPWSPAS